MDRPYSSQPPSSLEPARLRVLSRFPPRVSVWLRPAPLPFAGAAPGLLASLAACSVLPVRLLVAASNLLANWLHGSLPREHSPLSDFLFWWFEYASGVYKMHQWTSTPLNKVASRGRDHFFLLIFFSFCHVPSYTRSS